MRLKTLAAILAATALPTMAAAPVEDKPPAAHGMGLAHAAERNGYPGPMHVLELGAQLELSDAQREQTKALMQATQADARRLGRELVAAERDLNRLFAQKLARIETVRPMLDRISALRGAIRAVHLEAHLAQEKLLDPEQIDEYMRLRHEAHMKAGHNGGHSKHHY